jgi:DNA helicase-2/ATP-dependent DNA helicase PcrA
VFLPRVEEGQFAARFREPQQWAIVPKDVVRRASRYDCGEAEERRLFYVAATRAQRYLFVSAAGQHNNSARPSAFYTEFSAFAFATPTLQRAPRPPRRSPAQPRLGAGDQRLSFSQLKPLFECGYRFELQSRYGFSAPHHRAEGFGVALHNALAEVHRRAIEGDLVDASLADALCERHLRLPYADDESRARYADSMRRILRRYLHANQRTLARVELVEQPIRVHLDEGISVEGRVDLVVRRDDAGASVVDLKSDHRAQSEALTHTQLLLYALGYEELRGQRAKGIEVWELDTLEQREQPMDEPTIAAAKQRVIDAARLLRGPTLPADPSPERCAPCAVRAVCRHRAADAAPPSA